MLLVTLLWSSSFPIHKMLMNGGVPPLSLAGYRYFSASIILLVAVALKERRKPKADSPVTRPGTARWLIVPAIGLLMYSAQGIHMTALSLISASDSGLILNTTMPVTVAILAAVVEKNPPLRAQLLGLAIILVGIYIYFPHDIQGARLAGVLLNVLSASMGAGAIVLTRIAVGRLRMTSLRLTAVSMTTGSALLLLFALAHDSFFIPNVGQALWIGLLALVNTAFGFALFNHTLKTLGAFEVTVLQDSMIVQIGILSAIFLGEAITPSMALGMLIVVSGIVVVQRFAPERRHAAGSTKN
jgi:drug/metabolite transporter (DMT)-like permease